MINFFLAILLLIGTPGPGVLSLAGVGSAYGYRDGARYMSGLWAGNNLVALAVITGLAAVVLADERIRIVLGIASALYLLWLAFRIAFAGSQLSFIERPSPPGIKDGVLLQIINPKAYVVNTAVFANFPFFPGNPALEILLKFLIFNVVWTALHILWLWLGVTLQRLDLPAGLQRKINVAMAIALVLVVGLAFFAQA